jgi:hypothetical protein
MAGHLALTSRRRFLSAGLVGLTLKAERNIGGSFVNESHALGHRCGTGRHSKCPRARCGFRWSSSAVAWRD